MAGVKKVFETLGNIWNVIDLRKKIIFTLGILVLYRIGTQVPVPFLNPDIAYLMREMTSGTVFGFLNVMAGDAFVQANLFALSISPYITASIVMQLLCVAIPTFERWSKEEGESGKKKITQITRVMTVALALITAFGYYQLLRSNSMPGSGGPPMLLDTSFFAGMVIVATYCAGASLIMWLAEKINEKGIGNGISIILFVNIISRGPAIASNFLAMFTSGEITPIILALVGIVGAIAMVAFIVFFSNSERRIPVQYAKRVVGRKQYGGQNSNLPIKLNMSGVMPIIFANSIVAIPATAAMMFGWAPEEGFWYGFFNLFNPTSLVYIGIFLALLIAFAYFYISISFNPVEISNNLKKNGGFVPGIRPGKPTTDYITKILNRIVLIGALFLIVIAGTPMIIAAGANLFDGTVARSLQMIAFGGTSILIVVGVAMETAREIEAQMTMRHFKGFLE